MTADTAAPRTSLAANSSDTDRGRSAGGGHHRRAVQHALDANTTHLDLRLGPAQLHLTLPPVDKLAFYVGLAGAVTFGVIEWPIAIITGIGHALSDDRHHRTVRALGEALDAA